MLPRKLWRRLRSLLTPKRKRRIPIYGRADAQWFTAISLSLEPNELPSVPSSLAVCVALAHGYAGVGWYDVDGLAEEIHVGPGPCTRIIHLTLWNPALCRSLIVRSVRRGPLAVTL